MRWFKAKEYGWGWRPCTWQGWGIILLYVLGLIGYTTTFDFESATDSTVLTEFLPIVFGLTLLVVLISWLTGEKPEWRWGGVPVKMSVVWGGILGILISIIIAQLAGFVGAFFTVSAIPDWYTTLIVPSWNPPSWLFAPVWTILYSLMGIASYLVWYKRKTSGALRALGVYTAHLILNALWSVVFFGMHSIGGGLMVIMILWALIVYLTRAFYRIEKLAGVFMVPYLLWVSFALILNGAIFFLN